MKHALLAPVLLAASVAATAQPQPMQCSDLVHRQFDFWIGEWAVTDNITGQPAGTSHVEKIYGGCVLRENYAAGAFRGGSLNSYWRGDQRWHQTWMDSAGAFRHFVGGLRPDGQMEMTAAQPHPVKPGTTRLVRLRFTPNPDGTVRQYSDFSDDGGGVWQLRYDYLYRPIAK